MVPVNNSDTAWLIVSDYNQDNDLLYEDLREDVLNPDVSQWCYESRSNGVGFDVSAIGGYMGLAIAVGAISFFLDRRPINYDVGGGNERVGSSSLIRGSEVGGNINDYEPN
jgi:hypothetical protein